MTAEGKRCGAKTEIVIPTGDWNYEETYECERRAGHKPPHWETRDAYYEYPKQRLSWWDR